MLVVEVKNLIEYNVILFEDCGFVFCMSIVGGDFVFVDVDFFMFRLIELIFVIFNYLGVWF